MTPGSAGADAGFDLDGGWGLDGRVSIRPEPFGALLYHFGTRRLTFLKSPELLAVVRGLASHPDARTACRAAGVPPEQEPQYARALASLAAGGMIARREADPSEGPDRPSRLDHLRGAPA